MPQRLLYETHMHTPLCGHATGDPEQYAAFAEQRGLRGIIVTCHNPMPGGYNPWSRMRADQFEEYVAMVDRARRTFANRVDVRLGLECDYLPGMEAFLAKQIDDADLHYVLGSVHPFMSEYAALFDREDPLDFQRGYFTNLVRAAESRLFDCLSHPDLVKNMFARDWDVSKVMDHIRRCLDRIAATGIAMELNTSGLQKPVSEFNPGPQILREIAARGIPMVIGADAHVPQRTGDRFIEALDALEAAGFSHVHYFLERTRQQVTIDQARQSLLAADPRAA